MIKIFSYAVNIVLLAFFKVCTNRKGKTLFKDWKKQGPKNWNSTDMNIFTNGEIVC